RRKHNSPHGRPTRSSRSLSETPRSSRAARDPTGRDACEQPARRRARNAPGRRQEDPWRPELLRKLLAHRCQT
ncbi:unnamed protein product, partial [Ixodes persulcatus]